MDEGKLAIPRKCCVAGGATTEAQCGTKHLRDAQANGITQVQHDNLLAGLIRAFRLMLRAPAELFSQPPKLKNPSRTFL